MSTKIPANYEEALIKENVIELPIIVNNVIKDLLALDISGSLVALNLGEYTLEDYVSGTQFDQSCKQIFGIAVSDEVEFHKCRECKISVSVTFKVIYDRTNEKYILVVESSMNQIVHGEDSCQNYNLFVDTQTAEFDDIAKLLNEVIKYPTVKKNNVPARRLVSIVKDIVL